MYFSYMFLFLLLHKEKETIKDSIDEGDTERERYISLQFRIPLENKNKYKSGSCEPVQVSYRFWTFENRPYNVVRFALHKV